AFDKNEIAVIDVNKQTKILSYDVKDEWVGGIALSDDGKYLAAKTHKKIYLFDTSKPKEPVWIYGEVEERQGDVKGGVDISGDGTRIIASIGGSAILFDSQSNKPLWVYKGSGNQAYNVAISKDGKYMAMGTAGGVSSTIQGYQSSETTNLLILWNEKSEVPLWQYHAEGNFHDVSLSDDGSFITGATGCPDRRFYLFSKDSNRPIIRSEMLTRDSPVHRAKISGDGKFAAVGSELDDGAVFLFSKDSSLPAWKAPMPDRSSVRALNLTADGNYIGAATFKGDVFIFGRDSNDPISHWKVDASLGGIDIAEDGNFVATGGTDNKLRIFRKGASEVFSIDFNEYVQEIDISANGKYIAAGTGGSVYFFEAFDDDTQVVECKEIIEPPVESTDRKSGNIKTDSVPKTTSIKTIWPGMLFGFGFLASFLSLVIYIVVSKFDLISKIKTGIFKKSVVTTGTEGIKARNKLNKKIIIIMAIVGIVFLLLMTISVIVKSKNEKLLVPNQENLNTKKEELQEIGCGNSMCEPDFGETKANCPQDCTEGI
ncbi:MAG: WD40 repeat domain-containing protein, partial [Candidatus Portnoybacteria bacterium]|nr:WD40 repeat domain-containing protein [Candidatus Portnoybacteria bacterium]